MVRNAASMQNIQASMSDLNPSSRLCQPKQAQHQSEHPTAHHDDSQGLETLGTRYYMPMFGDNERAKFLMNRVATREATELEQAEFNDHMQTINTRKGVTARPPSSSHPDKKTPPAGNHALAEYQRQLDLVDGINRRRLQLAREEQDRMRHQFDQDCQQAAGQEEDTAMADFTLAPGPEWPNYQDQLRLLEDQNKKRLLMARQERDSLTAEVSSASPEVQDNRQGFELPDCTKVAEQETAPKSHAQQDYELQLRLLEQQNEKRRLLALQEKELKEMRDRTDENGTQSVGNEQEGHTADINHLQDYEYQIMLVEQRNRKRLLGARQEQDDMVTQSSPTQSGVQGQQQAFELPVFTKTTGQDAASGHPSAIENLAVGLKLSDQQNKKREDLYHQQQDEMRDQTSMCGCQPAGHITTESASDSTPSSLHPLSYCQYQAYPSDYCSTGSQSTAGQLQGMERAVSSGKKREVEDWQSDFGLPDRTKIAKQDTTPNLSPTARLDLLDELNKPRPFGSPPETDQMREQRKETELQIARHEENGSKYPQQDYKYELMLLEQHNKMRGQVAHYDQAVHGSYQLTQREEEDCQKKRRRVLLGDHEREALKYGEPDSTWEQNFKPFLYMPPEWCTDEQNAQVERMWEERTAKLEAQQTKTEDDARIFPRATHSAASEYCKPFCDFLTDNPTVFHAVDSTKRQLKEAGWKELDERESWDIQRCGRYFVERNSSSMIAFVVGEKYEPGNGAAILAGHVDAITAKLKPISEVPNKAGYLQLGVAPYAGGLNSTWWDRDLGIGGRVLVKQGDKIVTKLVKLDWPIARIPTLAPHFGAAAQGPFNKETEMVPIIGLQGLDSAATETQTTQPFSQPPVLGGEHGPVGSFVRTQPAALVKAISNALGLKSASDGTIVNWELELFDIQPATVGGLNKEFIFAGRIDDKLCSWAAMQALTGNALHATRSSSIIKVVGWFDDEEIGSQLRQGAKSNFLPQTMERIVGSLAKTCQTAQRIPGPFVTRPKPGLDASVLHYQQSQHNQESSQTSQTQSASAEEPFSPRYADDMHPSHVERRKRNFTNRTRHGCHTCRYRKKKCDEGKPTCQNCERGGFQCSGYEPKPPQFKPPLFSKPAPMPMEHGPILPPVTPYQPQWSLTGHWPPPPSFPECKLPQVPTGYWHAPAPFAPYQPSQAPTGYSLPQPPISPYQPQQVPTSHWQSPSPSVPVSELMGRTYANSFLLSSDVTHAVNPNFLGAYLQNHAPHLNVGLCVAADSNGHMTTDAVSTAILQRCADKVGAKLQIFQIRNDSRSGGTVGPMLSSMTGIRAIDAGLPQLSMHSIRATTGSLDPGLGVLMFKAFLNGFEEVDKEFRP